jgi:hypothetical protein
MSRTKLFVAMLLATTAANAVVHAAPPSYWKEYRKEYRKEEAQKKALAGQQARIKAVANQPIIGITSNGSYYLGGDRVILIATEFRGEFTNSRAERNFMAAYDKLRYGNKTVTTRRYDRTLAEDRHAVYGWYNVTRDEYGYVAFRIFADGRSAQVFFEDSSTRTINDWHYRTWKTNGFQIKIQIADDDKGGVAAIFHRL